jgi:hypothetical protein
MFISKAELEKIRNQIEFLQELAIKLQTEINELKGTQKKPRQGRDWTPEQRAQASEQMKQIWKNKKENA